MQDWEAAFAAITFAFDVEGCNLHSLNVYWQLCQSAAVSKGAHGGYPQTAYSNSLETVEGELCCSLSPAGTHCLAPQLSMSDQRDVVSVGVRRDFLQVVVPLRLSRLDGLHGI
jgi:hypothetical protein